MKNYVSKKKALLAAFPLSALSLAISSVAIAQTEDAANQPTQEKQKLQISSPIEEVMVLGRLQSAAQDLVLERMEFETVVDLLGAEQISRVGDSTVAAALRRVPGVTLVDGQFIYVRGLGERYSSSTLNGATVPSPDLTRNVLPLDIFPTSIVESIAVQKGYSANMAASFGGGNVNIRTKGIPEKFLFSLEAGAGINSESDDILSYKGGDNYGDDDGIRAFSSDINTALRTYSSTLTSPEASLTASSIRSTLARQGTNISLADAQAINANLITGVYRDLDVSSKSKSISDTDFSISLGNLHGLGSSFEFGYLLSANYEESARTSEKTVREFTDPTNELSEQTKSTETTNLTFAANFGLRWGEEHEISSKNIFIRNTDDDVSITNIYTGNKSFNSGLGDREFDYRFEQRELEVYQIDGKHVLGYETKEALGLGDTFLDDLEFHWFYSNATANTDIPSETNIQADITRNRDSGVITSSNLRPGLQMMDVRYTELEDKVESNGFEFSLPINISDIEIKLLSGGKYDQKTRTFEQLDLSIGTPFNNIADAASISTALSDTNILDPVNGYTLTYQGGLSRSYLAANTTDAYYGQMDIKWNSNWRFVAGARYEEYKQFSAPWQPYRRTGSPLLIDPENPDFVFYEDDVYGAISLTYSTQNFGAEDFNLRFAASETVVRPDLREVADASYQDPLTDIIVNGNPDVVPSELTNFDIRGEWFFTNGDSFTVSLFLKDIKNPIEYFQTPAGEGGRTASIENAETGSIHGIEFEWLNSMQRFFGDAGEPFYISGNLTLADSEIEAGDDLLTPATNRQRALRGASDYAANIQLGYDSNEGKHASTLVYNVFGERIFAAGISSQPDEFEQPFNSLDLIYSYYPTDNFTFKFKAKNLLDENVEIKQGDITTFEKTVGQTVSLSIKYDF